MRVAADWRKGWLVNDELISRADDQIGWILEIRRKRIDIFGANLFSDPAWDILLDLYEARQKGRKLKLEDLQTDAPRSTLARWATVLADRGLINCELDPAERSVLRLEISGKGAIMMSKLLQGLRH
jgi:hypothetical protein